MQLFEDAEPIVVERAKVRRRARAISQAALLGGEIVEVFGADGDGGDEVAPTAFD